MANVLLKFYGTQLSETSRHSLVAYSNQNNEIFLCIQEPNFGKRFICLDKSTAIRLVRELKKQIGNLESEVNNE